MSRNAIGRLLDRYEIDIRIVECISRNPNSTIDFISKHTGLSYTAVRNSVQRLTSLEVIVLIDSQERRGSRGRPAARFRISKGLQISIPPRQFQHLAQILVDELISDVGTARVEQLLNHAAESYATQLWASWQQIKTVPTTLTDIVQHIGDEYNLQGSYAQVLSESGKSFLQVRNCIYKDLASAYPGIICQYHISLLTYLIQRVTEKFQVDHNKCMAKGDAYCQFIISEY